MTPCKSRRKTLKRLRKHLVILLGLHQDALAEEAVVVDQRTKLQETIDRVKVLIMEAKKCL